MSNRIEVLESLDLNELEALADSKLAPSSQQRLDELLARNSESDFNDEDAKELDQLLGMVDQLNSCFGGVGQKDCKIENAKYELQNCLKFSEH